MTTASKRAIWAWALYDWANSAFATTVMAGFFPVFYKQFWASGESAVNSTFQLGVGNSIASLLIMLLAPFLGAVADHSGKRKEFLSVFTLLGVAATGLLAAVGAGQWAVAIALYSAATVGFMGANIFYDALLLAVSDESNRDRVSALGFALGYLGGGLLFSLNVAMALFPSAFGLVDGAQAVRLSFLSVAVWWLVFTIPLWRYVPEGAYGERCSLPQALRRGLDQLLATVKSIRRLRPVLIFLLAYWLYIDGVDTIIRMAVDYGLSLGIGSNDLIAALLMTQFIAFPAAIAFGHLGQRWGTKRALFLSVTVYIGVVSWAAGMASAREFFILAGVIGLVQGGVQSLSRSYYATLIPPAQSAEFFGFYNMMGKSAVLLGPLLVGGFVLATGSHRLGILSILLLFFAGLFLLAKVPDRSTTDRQSL